MNKLKIGKHSLIPHGYKNKDPRQLMYHFPEMPKIKFVKLMTTFSFYRALEAVEEAAFKNGFILLPNKCMHWKRAKEYSEDRKVKVFGKTFFMMKESELTKSEKRKLEIYLEDEVGLEQETA